MSRLGKRIVILLILLASCLIAGRGLYQYHIESSRTIQEKVGVGGYGLYVECYGRGKPTVIFESGIGCAHDDWKYVQPVIAKTARTFSYDRAGLGKSDKCTGKKTVSDQVKALHKLLENTKVKGPYILVVHSLGGFHARLFADLYPNEVLGIVFVDSASENMTEFYERVFNKSQLDIFKKQFKNAELSYEEIQESEQQVKAARAKDTLKDMPVVVLSAPRKEGALDSISKLISPQWMKWQEEDIVTLSDNHIHTIVKDSGHMIQLDQPQAVIDAINDIIDMVK